MSYSKYSFSLQSINFANDTTAFVSVDNIDKMYEMVIVEIDNINKYVITNKLGMNEIKTTYQGRTQDFVKGGGGESVKIIIRSKIL